MSCIYQLIPGSGLLLCEKSFFSQLTAFLHTFLMQPMQSIEPQGSAAQGSNATRGRQQQRWVGSTPGMLTPTHVHAIFHMLTLLPAARCGDVTSKHSLSFKFTSTTFISHILGWVEWRPYTTLGSRLYRYTTLPGMYYSHCCQYLATSL